MRESPIIPHIPFQRMCQLKAAISKQISAESRLQHHPEIKQKKQSAIEAQKELL